MNCQIKCECGSVQGQLKQAESSNRGVCYCKDCQAFAHFVGEGSAVLDVHGGTEIIQTSPQLVEFTVGRDKLCCMKLTDSGLLRWYASCCQTPIGNTPAKYQMSFVGLISNCLQPAGETNVDDIIGPIRMRFKTEEGIGEPPKTTGVFSTIVRFAFSMARLRLTGEYRATPFFSDGGKPIATPKVLSATEHEALFRLVSSA